MTGPRALRNPALRGAPPDAAARWTRPAHTVAGESAALRDDIASRALALLAESALAATGAELVVAGLYTAQEGHLLRAQAGRGVPLADEVVARICGHLHLTSTGWWAGDRFAELTGGDGASREGAGCALGAVPLRLGRGSGVLLAVHRSRIADIRGVLAPLARVAALAPRVAEGLQAVARRERHVLARALHDTLAQTLTELVFATDPLADDTGDRGRIGRMRELVVRALRDTRTVLSSALALEDYPFPAAISDLVRDLRQANIDVRLHETTNLKTLAPELERCVRYAAREALVNVRRHARADRVDLTLESRDGRVLLTVVDNGMGSSRRAHGGAPPWSGLGLGLLRGMVDELGGSLRIDSAPDRGTCLTLALPLAADDGRCGR